jgi:gamma-glutamylcyclotransferase (GGCT)/AIG2-like uncharacterized protein YtfP
METVKVFVYGTLMPGECNHQAYCDRQIEPPLRSYVFGKMYHLSHCGYPGVCAGEDKVWGYCLTFPGDFCLDALDQLEDYQPGRDPHLNDYERLWEQIFTPQGEPLTEAWLYRMSPAKIQEYGGIYLPSGQWSGQKNDRLR